MKKLIIPFLFLFVSCVQVKKIQCTVLDHQLRYTNCGKLEFITLLKYNDNVNYTTDPSAYIIPVGNIIIMKSANHKMKVAK